jgi:class 3 adenylate cyclase
VRVAPASSSPEALDGERKTVTALFADIKGSMELIGDLDPEEARRLVDPALKLMMDVVHRYEGYVAQSTGDGIFALFGAPVAHEDHPPKYHAGNKQLAVNDLPCLGGRNNISRSISPRSMRSSCRITMRRCAASSKRR